MTIRVACIGAGYFSRFHYDAWSRIPDVEVVGACDQDIDKANETGNPAFTSLPQMLSDTKPDLLDIILPPKAHADVIQTALEAGVRSIICQKPFCTSFTEAKDITRRAELAGATLIIHENFRFQPWFRRIKRALDDRLVGQVQQVTFRLRPGDGQGPSAYLDRQPYFQTMPQLLIHETAVHYIDTFTYLLGPPTAVYADLRKLNPVISGEDAGLVLFDHAADIRAVFDGNRHLDHASDQLRRTMGEALVEGTDGALDLFGDGSVWHRRFGDVQSKRLLAPDQSGTFGGNCVHALQSHVVSGLIHKTAIENTARDYLNVIKIKDAIYRSAAEQRKIALDPNKAPV